MLRAAKDRDEDRRRRENFNEEWASKGLASEEVDEDLLARQREDVMKQIQMLAELSKQAEQMRNQAQER